MFKERGKRPHCNIKLGECNSSEIGIPQSEASSIFLVLFVPYAWFLNKPQEN
jgi:hypothetical protein